MHARQMSKKKCSNIHLAGRTCDKKGHNGEWEERRGSGEENAGLEGQKVQKEQAVKKELFIKKAQIENNVL